MLEKRKQIPNIYTYTKTIINALLLGIFYLCGALWWIVVNNGEYILIYNSLDTFISSVISGLFTISW